MTVSFDEGQLEGYLGYDTTLEWSDESEGEPLDVLSDGEEAISSDESPDDFLDALSAPDDELAISATSVQALKDNVVNLANREFRKWGRGKIKESDKRVRRVLEDYWKTGTGKRFREPNWWSEHPWSAAFISWIMRKAGAGDAFRYSAAHAVYIKDAKDNRLANNDNPFKAYRVTEMRPQVGDLVCKSRERSGANYENIRRGFKTHCDIVTELKPNGVVTIGGNVKNSVSKTFVLTDSQGHISQARYFAVIRVVPPSGEQTRPSRGSGRTPGSVASGVFAGVPSAVRSALRRGLEPLAIRIAVGLGIRDKEQLTNWVFFARHMERQGQPIARHEKQLAKEWLAIRDKLVEPVLLGTSRIARSFSPATDDLVRVRWTESESPNTFESGLRVRTTAPFQPAGDPRDIVIGATAVAEGGYDTVNMYDRGILSWGIMQWTLHAGSLQKMLGFVKRRLAELGQASLWNQLFPDLDVRVMKRDYQIFYRGTPVLGIKRLRQVFRGSPIRGRFKKDVIKRWAIIFAKAGRHPVIRQLQREVARLRVDEVMNKDLGRAFVSYKQRICSKRNIKPAWRRRCRQLPRSADYYRSNFYRIRDYIGSNSKGMALVFGMWTNNPAETYLHLKRTIAGFADRYGTFDTSKWPAEWRREFTEEFERVLRASRVGYWGDAKARAAKGRTSRTQKILNALVKLRS